MRKSNDMLTQQCVIKQPHSCHPATAGHTSAAFHSTNESQLRNKLTILLLHCAPGVPHLAQQDLGGSTAPHSTPLTPQVEANCVCTNNSSTKGDIRSSYQQQQSPAPLQAAPSCADQCSTLSALVCVTQQHWVAASLQGMMRAVCSRLCHLAPCL